MVSLKGRLLARRHAITRTRGDPDLQGEEREDGGGGVEVSSGWARAGM